MGQSTSAQTVQVPNNVLQALTTSIDALRNEVAGLRHERTATKHLPKNTSPFETISVSQYDSKSTPPSDGASRKTFQYFPKLPVELRCAIWRFAAKEPRIAVARVAPRAELHLQEMLSSKTRPPPILYASREARQVSLETWTCFTTQEKGVPRVYTDSVTHILWLVEMDYERAFGEEAINMWKGLPSLQKLALQCSMCHTILMGTRTRSSRKSVVDFLRALDCMGVRNVLMVLHRHRGGPAPRFDDVFFFKPRKCPERELSSDGIPSHFLQDHRLGDLKKISWCHLEASLSARIGEALDEEVQLKPVQSLGVGLGVGDMIQRYANGLYTPPSFKYVSTMTRKEQSKKDLGYS